MPAEPLPVKELLDDFDTQWNASNVLEPRFIEVTVVLMTPYDMT